MSTTCGWCSRAGYDECFCGAERAQPFEVINARKKIEVTSYGVEIELFDRQGNLTHILTLDPMDTTKVQLLAEILQSSTIDVQECHY